MHATKQIVQPLGWMLPSGCYCMEHYLSFVRQRKHFLTLRFEARVQLGLPFEKKNCICTAIQFLFIQGFRLRHRPLSPRFKGQIKTPKVLLLALAFAA